MTGVGRALSFVPMALAQGTGAEVEKPLAMVVFRGLVTATGLMLLVLCAICPLVLRNQEAESEHPFPQQASVDMKPEI
jgi:heavy metal efflux system protein